MTKKNGVWLSEMFFPFFYSSSLHLMMKSLKHLHELTNKERAQIFGHIAYAGFQWEASSDSEWRSSLGLVLHEQSAERTLVLIWCHTDKNQPDFCLECDGQNE